MNSDWIHSYIQLRDGVYYVRISVPPALRIYVGKSELKRSLNTRSTSEAARLAPATKVPVIIAPPPRAEFDAGRCNERQMEFKPSFSRAECWIPNQPRPVTDILTSVGNQTGVTVFDPAAVLCGRVACRTRSGDAILYHDAGHVTEVGARYVIEALGVRRALGLQ